jgi:glyceraldehyde 3-phosphate dehydrogenase
MIQTRYSPRSKIRLGINGFGRIGRCVLRALTQTPAYQEGLVEVAKINDLTDAKTLAHLLRYDSNHGVFDKEVKVQDSRILCDGRSIEVIARPKPEDLDWKSSQVDIVLECTGRMKNREEAAVHLQTGAKKVIISAPMKDADKTLVMGINDEDLMPSDAIVSNASCTTNCLAPVAKVLDDQFGIVRGSMTTVHAYTNDQKILDLPHSDWRRARAAAVSMIPTTTGAAKAVGLVLPHLKGKIDGIAIRVPTPNVSLVDFNVELKRSVSIEEINAAMKKSAEGELRGVLAYSNEELVSIDFRGRPESSIFDGPSTSVLDGNFVKVLSWYDNEWGFSCRMLDLAFLLSVKF